MNEFMNRPSSDFAAVRDGRKSMPLWLDIDLSTARSINAGTALVLNLAGNSFYCDQNPLQGVATVHFQDTSLGNTSAPITVNPGFIANVPFTQLLVENAAQTGLRLRIFYGVDLDFQPGAGALVVSTLDGGKARTLAGQAYSWAAGCGAVAAQYSKCQLWNPVGSGKRLIVKAIQCANAGAGNIKAYLNNVALTTLVLVPANAKLWSGPASAGEQRKENNAALTAGSRALDYVIFQAAGSYLRQLNEPVVLEPGTGLTYESETLNQTLNCGWEWTEEPI